MAGLKRNVQSCGAERSTGVRGAKCPAFVNGIARVNMPKENSATRYACFATKVRKSGDFRSKIEK